MHRLQSYFLRLFVLISLLLVGYAGKLLAEELPRASTENSFYIMPLFERYRIPGALTYEEKRAQFIKMKDQLGGGNLYHRLGFSSIYHPNVDGEVRQNLQLAQEYRVHIGLIFALQSHTRNALRNVANNDLRLYQWRIDGIDWKGAYTSSGSLEVPEDERDYKIPTPSRYALPLREFNAADARKWAEAAKQLMEDFPGVITSINGPIEEELAIGGHTNNDKLADYSPFAITEFRDWLRHRGMYDATSGTYAGEGPGSQVIGQLIDFDGVMRSQFYDDPTPNDANGTGVSFNGYFGTQFTTWDLRYWDLVNFPDPITDEGFSCTPQSGTGFTPGGFDAPRYINATSRFWRAWSYDIPDQGGLYPQGNPEAPAYGFRQHMVRNFVRDLFDIMADVGLPHELFYAHQIPGEALGNFTGAGGRNRSSASTVWTGYLDKFQTVGITRFGPIDPTLMTQYAQNWGIFEWHTAPNTAPQSQVLYDRSLADLNLFYNNHCRFLFPGWWKHEPDDDKRFPLTDSRFADAISDFMQQREEVPFGLHGQSIDYTPPVVDGIYGYWQNNAIQLSWSNRIWSDLLPVWSDWSGFSHFEVEKSTDGTHWDQAITSDINQASVMADVAANYQVRVRAVSKNALRGAWSEIIVVEQDAQRDDYELEPQYLTMNPDPALTNRVVIRFRNPNMVINPDQLHISVIGDGSILSTEPQNRGEIEKFWPMHSASEVSGILKLDNPVFADGLLRATVSPITPIDPYFFFTESALDGSALPHISFRLYSDRPTSGQLYWFFAGGHRSISYPMESGWQIYSFSNIPDWVAQQNIARVRMDPGTTALAEIMFDWMAISSQPVSDVMRASPAIQGNTASIITSPTATPGSYTVSVSYGDIQQDIVVNTAAIYTDAVSSPEPKLVFYPNPASETFTISVGGSFLTALSIVSLDGRIMLQSELYGNDQHVIPVHALQNGVYILKIVSKGRLYTEKLIIQR